MSVIYPRVALIGLGLIASSMAHAMRAQGLAAEIIGHARSAETRAVARELFCDRVCETAAEAVQGADLVVLAVPIGAMGAIAAEIVDNTAPVSIALTRQMLWQMLGAAHPMEAHRVDSRGILARGRSGDAREGVVSFLEKRAPSFPDTVSADLPDVFPSHETPKFS